MIDNPPFSIISKIVNFYEENNIDYFLFAPHLTLLGIKNATSHICVGVTLTYENGARVSTSFVCSKGARIKSDPKLYELLNEVNKTLNSGKAKAKYEYPLNVITSTKLSLFSKYGVEYEENNCCFVKVLDEQKQVKKTIFGGGFIVPTKNITKKLKELRKLKELEKSEKLIWKLSEREMNIVRELDSINNI